MNKKINTPLAIILIVSFAVLLSEIIYLCGVKEIKNQRIEKQVEVISNGYSWQEYFNKEYGFELSYPENWYWEDYSSDFKNYNDLQIGFYPSNKKKGWEYIGDIEVSILKKDIANENVFDYYKRTEKENGRQNLDVSTKEKQTKNGYDVIIEYDAPGNIDYDTALIDCKEYFLRIATPFSKAKNMFHSMIDTVVCEASEWQSYKNPRIGYSLRWSGLADRSISPVH